MYTILVTESNELVTSVKERIMQRSKLVDNLHFLVAPTYKTHNMADFTVMMEYVLPISREYKTEMLTKSDALYKDMLEYTLPFDTSLTKEHGKIEVQLTFTKVSLDADGMSHQSVRKTSPTTITIIPISAWSDVVADSALSALDQRLIQIDAMVGALSDMSQALYETKADNIIYDTAGKYIQLTANGTPIGNRISITSGTSTSGVVNIEINENGELIVHYADGQIDNLGTAQCGCEKGIYVPHFEHDKLIFTLQETSGEDQVIYDLDPSNEWQEGSGPEIKTNFIWEWL